MEKEGEGNGGERNGKSHTSLTDDAKPVNTAKREPEIEVRPLREQEEAHAGGAKPRKE